MEKASDGSFPPNQPKKRTTTATRTRSRTRTKCELTRGKPWATLFSPFGAAHRPTKEFIGLCDPPAKANR